MKKYCLFLIIVVLLLSPALPAQAGYNQLDVAADGKGIQVYATSAGKTQAGILYNGYSSSLSLEDTNGLYDCNLTPDYTVWLNQRKAEKNQPSRADAAYYSKEWDALMPSNIFVAEVTEENAPFYTTPGHKRLSAKHAAGTLVKVCGEFGDDYFVSYGSWYQSGFMPKASLRKIRDITYTQANYSSEYWGLNDVREATVYTGGTPLAVAASATGYCDIKPAILKDGANVTVFRMLRGGWAQLSTGHFVENRFLDPEGDHSVTYATVKTSGVLNRLQVRYYASTDAWVSVKLCSGAKVQAPSHTDAWASVYVTGPGGGTSYSGSAQMQYLAFGEAADKVKNGCVRVRLKDDLYVGGGYDAFGEDRSYRTTKGNLPAGTEMTVIGVLSGYDIENDDADMFLCLMDDGTALNVWNDNGGLLEPIVPLGVYAKAASDVRMRQSSSKEAKVLRTLSKGTKVEVLLRGEGWTIVKYKDQTGCVMSRYLQFP